MKQTSSKSLKYQKPLLTIKLPLCYKHPRRGKTPKNVTFSLNSYIIGMTDRATKWASNHYYEYLAKKYLQRVTREALIDLPELQPPFPKKVLLTIYRGSNTLIDMDNTGIIIKFAQDVIKEKHIPEDNFRFISNVEQCDGGLKRGNPHALLQIFDKPPTNRVLKSDYTGDEYFIPDDIKYGDGVNIELK